MLRPLFIASIGNPRPYLTTRHSAGHILLDALNPHLSEALPANTTYRTWRSPSYMNVSGPRLLKDLKPFLAETGTHTQPQRPATLVILHDELESPLGKLRVKRGGPESASLRGHRGLISIFESLRGKGLYVPDRDKKEGAGNALSILRVGIGIGRPESRKPDDVAQYVLSEMSARELSAVRNAVGSLVDILVEEVNRE